MPICLTDCLFLDNCAEINNLDCVNDVWIDYDGIVYLHDCMKHKCVWIDRNGGLCVRAKIEKNQFQSDRHILEGDFSSWTNDKQLLHSNLMRNSRL